MKDKICAIVLAAGMSRRMGTPKMALPWKGSTVLGTVLDTLISAGIEKIIVVVGSARDLVEEIVSQNPAKIQIAFNPNYENGEMIDSIKVGLAAVDSDVEAVLIVLGDQPQMESTTVTGLIEVFQHRWSECIVPSYQMRRGHPWLIKRSLWKELQECGPGYIMRDFLRKYNHIIHYLVVDTPTILQDLDTPEDYAANEGQVAP